MLNFRYRTIPVYWNSIDGRLETFYKSFESNLTNYVLSSISSFNVISYLKKNYLGETNYVSGSQKGEFLFYIVDNVIYDISKYDKELDKIWNLVGFITPFMFESITMNEPMRRVINIGEYYEILMKKTLKTKFIYFKDLSNKNYGKNKSNPLCNLPEEIIDKIGNYCGLDE